MVKLTKSEMQVVVDYLLVQHDTLFEMAVTATNMSDLNEARKDEAVIRKFLLAAKEKGLNIDRGMYSMENKIKGIDILKRDN